MHLLIISGRSGSGKTVLLNSLEDLGFYCVDNLPLGLLQPLVQELEARQVQLAVGVDARNFPKELSQLKTVLHELEHQNHTLEIIYLDANDTVLLRRFSETRRRHPLTNAELSLPEALLNERVLLAPIADIAALSIDTTLLSKPQLCALVRERFSQKEPEKMQRLQLVIQSFGFKHGTPPEIDFVFDVRCLKNPYWDLNLRNFSGKDQAVIDFLEGDKDSQALLSDIESFLKRWVPTFEADNRSYLTIGIGCTGGQHRSVYISEQLAKRCSRAGFNCQARHRDLS
jgi:UPF0042 nucleotide-binding protein